MAEEWGQKNVLAEFPAKRCAFRTNAAESFVRSFLLCAPELHSFAPIVLPIFWCRENELRLLGREKDPGGGAHSHLVDGFASKVVVIAGGTALC
jgi:hypothetical protein